MKTIQLDDPPGCCSTGICGLDVEPEPDGFTARISQLRRDGIKLEPCNLAQQPMDFVQNPAAEALPLVLLNGDVHLRGRHPTSEGRPALFRAVLGGTAEAADLREDLRRARIEPCAWIINQSVLDRREESEHRFSREVAERLATRTAGLPCRPEEPMGPDPLAQLAATHFNPSMA